ncbi:MAG: DEAD/DEAH box helicase [Acidiferrobacter sp.]
MRGSGNRSYAVRVTTQPPLSGRCECPVGYNCKHVAATLIAALSEPEPGPPIEAAGSPAHRWLRRVQTALNPAKPTREELSEHILYIARLRPETNIPSRIVITPTLCHRRPDGFYLPGLRTIMTAEATDRYGTAADRKILRWLKVFGSLDMGDGEWGNEDGVRLWRDIIATQRCHWENRNTPALSEGPPRASHFRWALQKDGTQTLHATDVTLVLPLATPWYLDADTRVCGPLEFGLPDTVAQTLLMAPTLTPEQATWVAQKMRADGLIQSVIPVPLVPPKEVRRYKPTPHLHLTTAKLTIRARYRHQAGADHLVTPIGRLSLDYGGTEILWSDTRAVIRVAQEARIIEIITDRDHAFNALLRLQKLGFGPLVGDDAVVIPQENEQDLVLWDNKTPDRLTDLTLRDVPALEEDGWRVTYADDYPHRPLPHQDAWYGEIHEQPGQDWFGLELGIIVNGEPLNILPALLRMVRNCPEGMTIAALRNYPPTQRLAVPLERGGIVALPADRIAAILSAFVDLYDHDLDGTGALRLSRQAPFIPERLAEGEKPIQWSGGERLRALSKALHTDADIPEVGTPKGLKAILRPYQSAGLNWLAYLASHELNGVLADDMGLGKTIQTLALFLHHKENGQWDRPSLIVAPTSLMDNWYREAARFAPDLRVVILQGTGRKKRFAELGSYDVVLTTYPLLRRDQELLCATDYHYLVLDEAHNIKNPRTGAAQVARRLNCRHKLALTGTPMENHLGELWALFDFLMPGLLGEERQFARLFRAPIEKHGDSTRRQALRQRIAPFLLRRTKDIVARDLPPKTEIVRAVTLTGSQRDLYETLRLAMHERIRAAIAEKGLARSQIVILDALLKLRQVCCDPRLVKLHTARPVTQSAKLLLLQEMLPALVEEGRRILIFSQFTSMLALIADELTALRIPFVTLTGDTQDRRTPVDDFQSGGAPVFLISLKAGGTGLNLTAADTVIHYDPWWNPSVEQQATDRAHRLGQLKSVFVYKLIAEGTVEEKILSLQAKKLALTSGLLSETQGAQTALAVEDVESLFAPLETL